MAVVLAAAAVVVAREEAGPDTKAGPPVHDEPSPSALRHRIWTSVVADITEHPTVRASLPLSGEGCLLASDRGVLDRRSDAVLPRRRRSADGGAAPERPVGTVVHSDRGSQFRSKRFVRVIEDAGLLGSMGRVGACADNAAMESFFALCRRTSSPKTMGDPRRAPTRDNHLDRGDLPPETTPARSGEVDPIAYETIFNPQVALAA